MYFPRLYPDELLYSGIARCRIHLGISSHKTLLNMLFGDTNVAAITDLPTHLVSLANTTGLDTANVIMRHTLFPLYAPFIPEQRRIDLFNAMLSSGRPTIGLAGASTALVKWPEWLRYCPACFSDMAARFGEPYWKRSWQILGVDACLEHGCHLLNSPIAFRRTQRHEFHPASPLFLPHGACTKRVSEESLRLAKAVAQLLALEQVQSPGYGHWTNLYRRLATESGAGRGRQVRVEVIWEKVLEHHRKDWLAANGLLASCEPPPWLVAMFRKHRKAFSALQHVVVWISLRPDQQVGEVILEATTCQTQGADERPRQDLSSDYNQRERNRALWLQAIERYGGAKSARQNDGGARYAWLYRHDKNWLTAANQRICNRLGNHSHMDWQDRDRKLVRQLLKIGQISEEHLSLPRKSRTWFIHQLPHRSSIEHHLKQLPLCRRFLERYAESVDEYQIRRITRAILDDLRMGNASKGWELKRRCGLEGRKISPLANKFIQMVILS
ncbi:transposase [Stutzerimonas stutzeri]|uniref:Transposase n=1 Tax=Stutzerimonas stutzeri TaxID=316 RepID=W8RGD5_STUST|nr:TnsD family Tn7-like transposition protein [Stutzerimonas stutzeri]AHL77567.1 transposase [Stutzerimonas stutzeri]MCQ4330472.1 TnsD family transposase [Stutzerimonas stutzeri]